MKTNNSELFLDVLWALDGGSFRNLSESRKIGLMSKHQEDIKKFFDVVNTNQEFSPSSLTKDQERRLMFLRESISSERPIIVLVPGGFKPLTRAHKELIENYAKIDQVHEVWVLIGDSARGEDSSFTRDLTLELFKLYKLNLNSKVKIQEVAGSPLRAAYQIVEKQNEKYDQFNFALGGSDKDPKRCRSFSDYFKKKTTNYNVVELGNCPITDGVSATQLREAIAKKDKEAISKLIPEDVDVDDFLGIVGNYSSLQEMSSMSGGNIAGSPAKKGKLKMNSIQEQQLRRLIRLNIKESIQSFLEEKNEQENSLKNLINKLILEELSIRTGEAASQETENQDEDSEAKDFKLVQEEIALILKQVIPVLLSRQEGAPKAVQVGHMTAILYALGNLFDEMEAGAGYSQQQLAESFQADKSSPYFLSLEAIENGGNEPQEETLLAPEGSGSKKPGKDTSKKNEAILGDEFQTIRSLIQKNALDEEEAAYQTLGAKRALQDKNGSWKAVRKTIESIAGEILETNLPERVWRVFRKWISENIRLHLLNAIEETDLDAP